MSNSVVQDLKTIAAEAKGLNKTADILSQSIKSLNDYLQSLNVGLTVYYTEQYFESSTDFETGKTVPCRYFLGYDRDQNGKWGICVFCRDSVLSDAAFPNHIKAKIQSLGKAVNGVRWIHAFETCPRNIRLSLAVYIPNVISGLAEAVKNITRQVDESIGQISEIDAQLKEATA
jgi:hypothetical protein